MFKLYIFCALKILQTRLVWWLTSIITVCGWVADSIGSLQVQACLDYIVNLKLTCTTERDVVLKQTKIFETTSGKTDKTVMRKKKLDGGM